MGDLVVAYERDPVGNPVAITDARGNAFTNTFFDSGQLAKTQRPSWWGAGWGPGRNAPDPARRFQSRGSGAMADVAVPVGGPQISESGEGGAASGGIGAETSAPGMAPTDFGEVAPESLPSLVPRSGLTSFDYDDELRLTRVTDVAGHNRRLDYDPQGRITSKRLPFEPGDPIVHSFAYDRNGNLTASTDGEGETTAFAYDTFDRMTEEDAPGSLARQGDPDGPDREITGYRYDPNSNLERRLTPRVSDSERLAFDFRYDPVDRLTREVNPANEDYTYTYDVAGNVASETSPRGNLTEFRHDTANRLTVLTEAVGSPVVRTIRFSYDANGNRTLITAPGADDKQSGYQDRTTCTAFDGSDRPWKTTVGVEGIGDGASRTTITEYDAQGNLRRSVNPRGVEGNCSSAEPAEPDTDPQGAEPLLPAQGESPLSREATVATYNAHGQITRRYLPWGSNSPGGVGGGAADINGVNQLDQNKRQFVQRFDYEDGSPGWLETVTEPYEVANPDNDPDTYATSYTHHPSGWFASQTDPDILRPGEDAISGKVVNYEYEKRGNQTRWTTTGYERPGGPAPDSRKVRRSFYPSGLLKQRTGIVTGTEDTEKRRYDYFYNRNRSLSESFDRIQDAIAGSPLDPGFRNRTIHVDRDRAERELVVDEQWSGGRDTLYAYDQDGNLTRRRVEGQWDRQAETYSGGRRTTFAYDELSRETETEVDDQPGNPDNETRDWETSYHPSDEIDTLSKPNGTTERHFFRADGLIEGIRRLTDEDANDDPGGGDKDPTYTYDPNGNRTSDERGAYAYNARDQLAIWDPNGSGEGNEPTSYVLNGSGQIAEERSADLDTSFEYAGQRLTERTVTPDGGSAQTYRYRYDDFGNTTRIVGPGAGTTEPPPNLTGACTGSTNWTSPDTAYFCWDEFSRLVTSKGSDPDNDHLAVYVHDGLDRRDFRITGGNGASELFREYSYVGLSEALSRERRDLDEGKNASYDYNSQGRRLGQTTEGDGSTSRRYYATDAQGSVEALEGPNGAIDDSTADGDGTETYAYDPYGALDQEGDPTADPEDELTDRAQANPFRFQGHYYDAAIKSYDMQARQYSPTEGRFLGQDVYASAGADLQLQTDPLTQNRYVFAGGNPVSRIEFDGHHCTRNINSGHVTEHNRAGESCVSSDAKGKPRSDAAATRAAERHGLDPPSEWLKGQAGPPLSPDTEKDITINRIVDTAAEGGVAIDPDQFSDNDLEEVQEFEKALSAFFNNDDCAGGFPVIEQVCDAGEFGVGQAGNALGGAVCGVSAGLACGVIGDEGSFLYGASNVGGNLVGPGKLAAPFRIASKGIKGARGGSRTSDATLDASGKVHGDLPKPADLGQYDPEDLVRLQDELRQSVQTRIDKTVELGADYGHSGRLAEEQDLIQSLNKHLADR